MVINDRCMIVDYCFMTINSICIILDVIYIAVYSDV
nr:MAG TPA: hypothetical protein [Caudoviricetes sp.]